MFNTNRDWKLYLLDILKECENIEKFTAGISYEEFTDNLEKVYAVAKAFENIGEAVKQLPKEITNHYSSIPWSEIAKMGIVFLVGLIFAKNRKRLSLGTPIF